MEQTDEYIELALVLSDGTLTNTFRVEQGQDGRGISAISLLGKDGRKATYVIYYTDGTSSTFDVYDGEKGDTGNGIQSVVLNADYTLTINYTDGTHYTTTSIRGEKGEQGEPGITQQIDQTYTPASANGQSGTAVAEAVAPFLAYGKLYFKDLNWTYNSTEKLFAVELPTDIYNKASGAVQQQITMCNKYYYHAYSGMATGQYVVGNYLKRGLHVKDTNYTNATDFKNANQNTVFYYLL